MSERLFSIIVKDVYKTEEIKKVSKNSSGDEKMWIFDFKGVSLSKAFLEDFADHFWTFTKETFGEVPIQVGGMETGAIPLIAGITMQAPEGRLGGSFYIRKSRKKSDLANRIEGVIQRDMPIILVDDILKTGTTLRQMVNLLEEEGHLVSAFFVCLRFSDMSNYEDFTKKKITIGSIFELNDFTSTIPVANLQKKKEKYALRQFKMLWKATLTTDPNLYAVIPKSAPIIHGDYLYVGADNGSFFCIDKKNEKVIWEYKIFFGSQGKRIFSSPVVYKDKVMFGAYDGNFYCLNAMTGKLEWVFMDADWIGSSPCVDERRGIVFIGLEFGLFRKHGGVAALSIKDGRPVWKNYSMEGLTHASPIFSDKYSVVVCGSNDTYIYAFDSHTGKTKWKFKTEGEVKYGGVFDDTSHTVIVGSMDGHVYVVDARTGEPSASFKALAGFYSTPVLVDNKIVIGSLDKNIYCFNLQTRETVWVYKTSGRIFASPAYDSYKKSIFIGSNDGTLYEVAVEDGTLLSRMQFSERIVNKIIVESTKEGTTLYVPTQVCELYKMIEIHDSEKK